MKKILTKTSLFILLIFSLTHANADKLWDNGDTDSATLGWGQYSSSLDDFYVPGSGWWVDSIETIGFYIDDGHTIANVDVVFWAHNAVTNAPDETKLIVPNNIVFNTALTGRTFLGRDEIKISADFDKTYLKGQEYYWAEITVTDEYGLEQFRFLARRTISHEPAWTVIGSGLNAYPSSKIYAEERDLSFAIFGKSVRSRFSNGFDELTNKVRKKEIYLYSSVNATLNDTIAAPCASGSSLVPFDMPIYDDKGLFVVDHKKVWFCIPDNLRPAG